MDWSWLWLLQHHLGPDDLVVVKLPYHHPVRLLVMHSTWCYPLKVLGNNHWSKMQWHASLHLVDFTLIPVDFQVQLKVVLLINEDPYGLVSGYLQDNLLPSVTYTKEKLL